MLTNFIITCPGIKSWLRLLRQLRCLPLNTLQGVQTHSPTPLVKSYSRVRALPHPTIRDTPSFTKLSRGSISWRLFTTPWHMARTTCPKDKLPAMMFVTLARASGWWRSPSNVGLIIKSVFGVCNPSDMTFSYSTFFCDLTSKFGHPFLKHVHERCQNIATIESCCNCKVSSFVEWEEFHWRIWLRGWGYESFWCPCNHLSWCSNIYHCMNDKTEEIGHSVSQNETWSIHTT